MYLKWCSKVKRYKNTWCFYLSTPPFSHQCFSTFRMYPASYEFSCVNMIEFFIKMSPSFLLFFLGQASRSLVQSRECKHKYNYHKREFDGIACYLLEIPNNIPSGALCVNLDTNQITSVPKGIFSNLSQCNNIFLGNNKISEIGQGSFKGLFNLIGLYLQNNKITSIKPGVFNHLSRCNFLQLFGNNISLVDKYAFLGMTRLDSLSLNANSISVIENGTFAGLKYLMSLGVRHNRITHIEQGSFTGLYNLKTLDLNFNRISVIEKGVFNNLMSCLKLFLCKNQISFIEKEVFHSMESLQMLDMHQNSIAVIKTGHFIGLGNLKILKLEANRIALIEIWAFDPLLSITSISLGQNLLKTLSSRLFINLPCPLVLKFSTLSDTDETKHLWDCPSLCWLKHEEENHTILLEGAPLCSDQAHWSFLLCENAGKIVFFWAFVACFCRMLVHVKADPQFWNITCWILISKLNNFLRVLTGDLIQWCFWQRNLYKTDASLLYHKQANLPHRIFDPNNRSTLDANHLVQNHSSFNNNNRAHKRLFLCNLLQERTSQY